MTDLLVARKVRKEFGGLVACNDVDFTVPEQGIVSLIGPNGAGKTTFFNMLTGAYTPTSGEVTFDGTEIAGLPPHRVTELGIGRTFQNIRLFQTMSSLENVMVGMHCRTKGGVIRSILRTPGVRREERDSRAKAKEILRYVGLDSAVDEDFAMNLSYGDQRRLEVARALATQPKLLLLDEPAAGMNPTEKLELTRLIRQVREQFGNLLTQLTIQTNWGGVVVTRHEHPRVEKYLVVRRGSYLALEKHDQKDERLEVREGAGLIMFRPSGKQLLAVEMLRPGATFHFQPGSEHCIIGTEDLLVFERSTDPKGMDQDLIFIYEPYGG